MMLDAFVSWRVRDDALDEPPAQTSFLLLADVEVAQEPDPAAVP